MKKEEIRKAWEKFSENNDFMLNPDSLHVDMVIEGVLENEKKYGLKFCPCRLTCGIREKDLQLLCPCNFKAQDVWKEKGRCWCGLFFKRTPE
jgi:ferredoxin-thioredoxin reductase catalytic subunit